MAYAGRHNIYEGTIRKMVTKALNAQEAAFREVHGSDTDEQLMGGMTILSALTDWALEGSVVTGDSMRSRGYGSAKRTSFMVYRMTGTDAALLIIQTALIASVTAAAVAGGTTASYTPDFYIAPVTGIHALGFFAYCAYLLIPTALHIKEAVQWHISRSKI